MKLKYEGKIRKDKAYIIVDGKRFQDGSKISKKEFDKINDASWKVGKSKPSVEIKEEIDTESEE